MSCRPQACLQCSQKCFKVHGTDPSPRTFSFFKIMMGGFNTALFIPPKFARTLRAKVNQITHLEDSNGHLWKVKFSKLEGSLVFQQGWGEFVEDHSIKFGYVLVFKYVTGLHFLVQIFSTSACEETNFSRNDNANHAPMKKSDIGPNPRRESSQSKNLFGTMIEHGEIKKGSLSMSDIVLIERPLSIEEKSSCLVNGLKPIKESSHSNKMLETMTEQNEIGKGNLNASGIVAIESPLSIGKKSSCPVNGATLIPKSEYTTYVGSSKGDPETPEKISETALHHYPVTMERNQFSGKELDVLRENDSKKGCYSKDELKICKVEQDGDIRDLIDPSSLDLVNFYCSVTISINSQSWLELPSGLPPFFKGRLVDGFARKLVLLRDSYMRVWPVVYIENNNCKAFCGGWQAFAIGNNLEQMDVCAFQRVSEIKDMIQVQIFKH